MNKLRRFCSLVTLLIAPFALLGMRGGTKPAPGKTYRAYLGTYTTKTNSKGIYDIQFDSATGKMSAVEVAGDTKDPSWVVVHPSGKYLYSVNEMGQASTVSAFAIDSKRGKLTLLNQLPSLGEDPCYLSFDRTGKFLFVANYTSGTVAVFPILADGKLGEHTGLEQDSGTLGPNKERQDGPHAHFIAPSEQNRFVYVADLGLDRVLIYRFDSAKGTLARVGTNTAAQLKPGTGPRHFAIDPTGTFLLAENQLSDTIMEFRINPTTGELTPTGETLTVPSPVCLVFVPGK